MVLTAKAQLQLALLSIRRPTSPRILSGARLDRAIGVATRSELVIELEDVLMPAEAPVQNAGGLLIDPAGRVLLGLRAAHKSVAPNLWDIVGGRVEPGESLEEALVREVAEELGVQPVRLLLLDTVPEPSHGPPHVLHHVFAITDWSGGDPYNACDEHAEIRWFTIDEVTALTNKTPLDFAHLHARGRASLPVRP